MNYIQNLTRISLKLVLHTLILTYCIPLIAAEVPRQNFNLNSELIKATPTETKLGLVFSGGGARGMAHVGVLKRLDELRVPVDYISGTSMGGIVAALYASGMSAKEIESAMIETDWFTVLNDYTSRKNRSIVRKTDDAFYPVKSSVGFNSFSVNLPKGLIEGQKVSLLIRKLMMPAAYINDFDHFGIPLRIIATNIENGEQVVIKSGNVSDAIQASMSVPGVFSPVLIDGEILVDGGTSDNLPVDVARKMGARHIIAIDVSTPLLSKNELNSVIDITGQMTGLQVQQNTQRSIKLLTADDILITPEFNGFSAGDFNHASEIINLGYQAANKKTEELKRYSISPEAYKLYRKRLSQQRKSGIRIEAIRIKNDSRLSDKVIREYLNLEVGDEIDEKAIRRAIDRLYGLGYFKLITYDIEYNENTTLVVTVNQKDWGPGYLNFGLLIIGSGISNSNSLNLRVGHSRTLMNQLGGEWASLFQIGTEPQIVSRFYQPLDYGLRYFIQPEISYTTKNYFIYEKGTPEAQYQSQKTEVNIVVGRELDEWGRISLRAGHYRGESVNVIGSVISEDSSFNESYISAHIRVDRLNNIHFPTKGSYGSLTYKEYFVSQAFEDYSQFEARYLQAFDFNRNTLITSLKFNSSVDDLAPIHSKYRAGGFLNMSGYAQDELIGNTYGQLMLVYMYKAFASPLFPVYLGASAEVGNMWQKKSEITLDNTLLAGSAFVGVDSILGPVFISAGYVEGGRTAIYVSFGYSFFFSQ